MNRAAVAIVLAAAAVLAACDSATSGTGTGSPGSSAPGSSAPGSSVPGSSAPSGSAPGSSAPSGSAPDSSASSTAGQVASITEGSTTLSFDAGFVAALGRLKLTPGLVGTATLAGTAVTLPVSGGRLTVYRSITPAATVRGEVEHANGSGISLTGGAVRATITDLGVDLTRRQVTATLQVNGKPVASHLTVFDLDLSTLRQPSIAAGGVVTVSGASAYLAAGFADVLNHTFRIDALSGDRRVKVGVLTSKVSGR